MTHVVAHEGYAAATIARVIDHAGVPRPTFYDYFTDKDDCFLAAHRPAGGPRALDARDRTIGEIEQIVERACAATPPDTPSPDVSTRRARHRVTTRK